MIDHAALLELVDGSEDHISSISDNLPALYAHVGLPTTEGTFSLQAVTASLYERIAVAAGGASPDEVRRQLRLLLNEHILQHVLVGAPLQPYASILEILSDALPRGAGSRTVPTDEGNWGAAVAAACDYQRLRGWPGESMFPQFHSRQFAVSKAALWLRKEGYEVRTDREKVFLTPDSEERLTRRLSELVRLIGGIHVAGEIMNCIRSFYHQEQERYHLVRRVSTFKNETEPAVPFGYLMQLTAKHPTYPPNPPFAKENWRELIELSTQYAALHDVQPYSTFELMFKDAHSLVRFLQEIALYDSFFTLVQIKPGDAIQMTRGVLSCVAASQKIRGLGTIEEVLSVAEVVLKMGRKQLLPTCFNWLDVASRCTPLEPQLVADILEKVLCHTQPGANQSYFSPTGENGPDFFLRPCLALGGGNYCLLAPALCAPAVIEALFEPLRETDPNFDGGLGFQIEVFLRRELSSRGIQTLSGRYQADGKDWECDIILETTDSVILLEIKKKPLTRKAKSGSDVSVILDLAGSLLDAQLQAGRHELQLRQQGFLDLTDVSGVTTRLNLNARHVERIAVSFFDFGGLQDRTLLEQFLWISANLSYQPVDPAHQPKFEKLNNKIGELREQIAALEKVNPGMVERPFFHCWFLSVPQIMMLLKSAQSSEDFKSELWKTRHFSTGSLDFYFDYAYAKRLKAK